MDVPAATIRFSAFGKLGAKDIAALMELAGPLRRLRRGEVIRHEGDPAPKMYFLLEGWTASSVILPNGERQAIKVHMPGDLLGMPGLALASAPDTIDALTNVTVSTVEPRAIGHIFMTNHRIAAMLFLVSQEERVYLMDRLASIGRTQALNRIAALILHLDTRMARSTGSSSDCYFMPLTQIDIADLTALTAVHVSRTLSQLAKDGVCTWVNRTLTILSRPKLRDLAGLQVRSLSNEPDWLCAPSGECATDG